MPEAEAPHYPGGSRSRVTKAGKAVRDGVATEEDLACIEIWRAAHAPIVNNFQAMLRGRAKTRPVIVGQRHKRKITIFGKLQRFQRMELARMDDIAGCRLIFDTIDQLSEFRKSFHGARFKHKLRHDVDKYDYLKAPKSTGYRGIHDVYEYDAASTKGRDFKGLFIELQYRTKVQHAWATTVELIGNLTSSQPKFQEGDKRYEDIMGFASEILARTFESSKSCHPDIDDIHLIKVFLALDTEVGLMQLLRNLHSSTEQVSGLQNAILILRKDSPLEVRNFRYTDTAIKALFDFESENPGVDVVLVKGGSRDDVRFAFKNYFADARDFVALIEKGCTKLSGKEMLTTIETKNYPRLKGKDRG